MQKLSLPVEAANYHYSKMSIEELNIKLDNTTFNNDDIIKVKLLLEAVNDWPEDIDSLGNFLQVIKVDLRSSELGYKVVNKKISKLNPSTQAWKMESYASLIELMQICDYKSLNEIIAYFENKTDL